MRPIPQDWALRIVRLQEPVIDPQPPRQRGPVWSLPQRQLFIDSILRKYDIPKLYLRQVHRDPYHYEVIDGQQRLRAIWAFYRSEYPLALDADDVDDQPVAGKRFDDLSLEVKTGFDMFSLQMVLVEGATDDEIDEMFIRYQGGVPLNSAEKRNAISGAIRDFVHELSSGHSFFRSSVAIPNRRFAHDEVLAQMTLTELNGGPTTVRHIQLKDMYEKNRQTTHFRRYRRKTAKIRQVLDFLARAFPEPVPQLIKASCLSIYLLASDSLENYAIKGREGDFHDWFMDFENRRQQDSDKPEDERDADMVTYDRYLTQQSADKTALEHRHTVLKKDLALFISDLELLDPRRYFTEEQRAAIFRNYDGKCANPSNNHDCQVECEWNNFHADHVVPWSGGGKTTVANGQLLCASCNLKKGASH